MIGSIIGGAIGIGSSIFGGIAASKAMKQVKNNLQRQRQENEDWFNRHYNDDATQRADAQRILTMTSERMRAANRSAAGSAAVMGGTEESVAATKAANAQAMADAASQIAANGERRRDMVESQYRQTKSDLDAQESALEQQRANNIAQAVAGAANAGSSLGGLF